MAIVERVRLVLTKQEQAAREAGAAIHGDGRLGANPLGICAEHGMAPPDSAHCHPARAFASAIDDCRGKFPHPLRAGAEGAIADDQRESDRIDRQDAGPVVGDTGQQPVHVRGGNRRQHGFMDRGDGARMAPREGDQILARFLRLAQLRAQAGQRMISERNDRGHAATIIASG